MPMLKVGYAEREITPPVGSLMACFPRGKERVPRRAEGAWDALKAKALVLSDDDTTACVCAADVSMWQAESVTAIRNAVAATRPILPAPQIMIAATHTHSSPEVTFMFGGTPADEAVQAIHAQCIAAVLAAVDDLTPASAAAATVDAPLNHNRRVPGTARMALEYEPDVTVGPTDPRLTVVKLSRTDREDVLWTNWTAHALTMGPANDLFTADYPGAFSRAVEARLADTKLIFTNGAAGNIHPRRCMGNDYAVTEALGAALADRAVAALAEARPVGSDLSFARRPMTFPNRVAPDQTATAELACLRLGDLTVGFVPGELYVEFQLEFRRALAPAPAFLVGYANAWAGYIPTEASYADGGYGVDLYGGDPPRYARTMLPSGAGERMLETLLDLAREVR